jgi:hypothetical protein
MTRWLPRGLLGVAAAALALLLAGVLGAYVYGRVQSERPVTLPAPTGPERVGRTVYDWTDPARADPYAPGRGTPRELSVWVWYPADPAPGAPAAGYWPADWLRGLAGTGGINDLAYSSPAVIHPHAVGDAPVADTTGPLPVLVLEPGLGLQASDYTTLAEDLASHGYVVAGVNPTYSTDVVLSGGRVVRSVARARDDADFGTLVGAWADDARFVATEVLALDAEPGGRFQGRLRVDHVGFLGHSAGGAAAVLACAHDARCAGAVDIDGDLAGDVLRSGLDRPFLFLGHDGALASEPALAGQLRGVMQGMPPGQVHVLSVRGTGHFSFTDRAVSYALFGRPLGFIGRIDGARGLRICGAFVRATFDESLLGLPAPLLTGAPSAYPEVHVEHV